MNSGFTASAVPPDAGATVRAYHERTKHHLQRYAAGPDTLDWDAQPNPFRRWAGAPLTELPLQADTCDVRWNDLFQPGSVAPQALSMPSLGLLFELALGLAAWKVFGPDRWAVRCNPSSGNLHPTEGWLVSHGVPGVADGVHHYAPHEHALELRASGRVTHTLGAIAGDPLPDHAPRAWIALSSVLWREAWKYGERAFRYCQIDAGHAVGALRYAAAVLGWSLRPVEIDAPSLAALLGLDRDTDFGTAEREEPEVLLEIVRSPARPDGDTMTWAPAAAPALGEATWHGQPNRLDRHPMYRWPIIDTVAQASRPAPAKKLTSASPSNLTTDQAGPASPPVVARSPQGPDTSGGIGSAHLSTAPRLRGHEPAARLIRQRRSAQHFDRRATAPLEQILPLLCAVQSRTLPLDAGPEVPRVHVVVFAHRVDGLEPGAYLLPRRDAAWPELQSLLGSVAEWQRCTDVEDLAVRNGAGPLTLIRLAANPALAGTLRTIDCHQALGSDAILAFSLLGEFDTALGGVAASTDRPASAEHPWGYRELLQEAGLVGQVLYMEAEAAGLAGTGIGCYFDDALHQLLGLSDTRLQALYHFTVGVPMHDGRIASEAPYAHRPCVSTEVPAMTAHPSIPTDAPQARSPGWSRLTADELVGHLTHHPDALILDARDERSHTQGHLPGSVRLDGRNHEHLLMREDRQRPVLIYCYHGNASQTYAQMFSDFGFAQVRDLIGGWTAWAQSGLALASPEPATASTRPVPAALAEWLAQEGFPPDDPQAIGPHGNTPLMHAAWRGQHHRVDELLDLGVRLDTTNGDGNSALWLACVNGELGLIRALAAWGVPLDHQNAVGATCLMYAASAGKPEVVRTLLELGADPHLTSQDDFSALDMAATVECLQLLRSTPRSTP